MKRIILFAGLLLASTFMFAQSEKYTAAMKKNLEALDTSFRNPPSLLIVSNNFERIAAAEKPLLRGRGERLAAGLAL